MFPHITKVLVLTAVLLSAGCLFADEPQTFSSIDSIAWKKYQADRRQQVEDLLGIWFPTWKPATVAGTYLDLSKRLEQLDLSGCDPDIRAHIRKAQRSYRSVAELIVHARLNDEVLRMLTGVPRWAPSTDGQVRREIFDLLHELREAEDRLAPLVERD